MSKKPLSYIKEQQGKHSRKEMKGKTPVFAQKQEDIIDLINRYWMSRYKHSDYGDNGRKVFFNIVENPVFVAAKMIDLDTKDINIVAQDEGSRFASWLLGKELKLWMKENDFSKLLNKVRYWLPKYGSVVVKKTKRDDGNKISLVPLENFYVEADAENLKRSDFIIEEHEYLPKNLKEMPWDNIDSAIAENEGEDRIKVYEYYGTIPGYDENYWIVSDGGDEEGVVLHASEKDEIPYKELHWDEVAGRWLGVGQVEKTFQAQIHMNKVANMKSDALEWTSKIIFQSVGGRDVGQNLLNEVPNGAVLTPSKQITQVANEERNLHAYREEEQRWLDNVRKRSFATDVIRGQRGKSGVPLGATTLAAQMAGGFFDMKREEMGIFIKELIEDWIIPDFKRKKSKKHILRFVGSGEEDMKRLDRMLLNTRVNKRMKDFIARNDTVPMPSQMAEMKNFEKQKLQNADERYIEIPDKFYDDAKFKTEVVITGESVDVQGKVQAIQTALQTTQDPEEQRKLRNQLMDLMGQSPSTGDSQKRMEEIVGEAARQAENRGSPPRARQQTPQPTATRESTTV